jgi:hypothetical protein
MLLSILSYNVIIIKLQFFYTDGSFTEILNSARLSAGMRGGQDLLPSSGNKKFTA